VGVNSIVVDTSALTAIALGEPDAHVFRKALDEAEFIFISAVNRFELGVVMLGRGGQVGRMAAAMLLQLLPLEVVPFDAQQANAALNAYARFGKGIHPQAQLNLADCAAYALATTMGLPLLFKGNDFPHTDVLAAV
jgi:ribonuclease VapC